MSLLIFIAILVALIWVHELGHFSAAKFFGIRVDEFAIGFPPRLLRVKWGETEYTFNLLLVGGFVKIYGEDPGTDARDPRSMAGKPRMVQAGVVVAGVVMNLLFGWLVLSAAYLAGIPAAAEHRGVGEVSDPRVTIVYVVPDSPAQRAGIEVGDTLVKLSAGTGEHVATVGDNGDGAREFIAAHQDSSIIATIDRSGEEKNILLKPEEGIVETGKAVGIQMADVGMLTLPIHLALVQGAIATYDLTISTAQGLGGFFGALAQGKAPWSEVAGPVGIVGAGAGAVNDGFASTAFLTALISINLAIFNLLPIPGLDGFRLVILAIEGALRRPLSPKIITGLSLAGFALIITLMVVVTYHDITRLIG
jgi:regulator of sigma E protease